MFLTKRTFLINNIIRNVNKSAFCLNLPRRCLSTNKNETTGGEVNFLKGYLKSKILMKGPITIAEYMKEALGNPKYVIILNPFFK